MAWPSYAALVYKSPVSYLEIHIISFLQFEVTSTFDFQLATSTMDHSLWCKSLTSQIMPNTLITHKITYV